MIEKLVENWLDKASELSYQPVFVQMLASEGYTVIHSTRHCLLEFGKDILAIDSDGVGCAFQLKGDPGGRLTVGEFRREIQPQLVQLMSQRPSYPGFPLGAHRSFLVSNGQFTEEVHAAAREMNDSSYPSKLTLWSRGHLFDMCMRHAERLWPKELEDSRVLLELYMLDPRDVFPAALFDQVLTSILQLGDDVKRVKEPEFRRVASSAAWVTGIAAASFAEAQNHAAVAQAWGQCCVALIGAAEKHADGKLDVIASSFRLAESASLDALAALWEEVGSRETLVEGDPLADIDILDWRVSTLVGLLTTLAVAHESSSLLTAAAAQRLAAWLKKPPRQLRVWGEAAMSSILPWAVWMRRSVATSEPDEIIRTLTELLVASNQQGSQAPLATPYYSAEEVLGRSMGFPKYLVEQPETFVGSSSMAEPVMHLLVRTNQKQTCKRLWSEFTRIGHRCLELASASDYCRVKARKGVEVTRMYPHTYGWSNLKREALTGNGLSVVPSTLASKPWLLALWWQVAPQRLNKEAARLFCDALIPGWGH